MAQDFEKMMRELVYGMRERQKTEFDLNELGVTDTVKLNRKQFCEVFGKMGGIESSNTNREHTEIKIGRLVVLENLLGSDKLGNLLSTIGTLFEEYLFGLPGGDPSEYRVAAPEADDTAEK